ncbi:type VII secretion protein EccCa [Solihabitans fulvus]|uniref:Type VII secretion protein EccCa n=1 Tax=Solihabitans fulvus TaxID=1892852 RepID=A0A5B2XUA4_9PSEU|nr:type VII secretion protein EccCa [Solihabitans fulvus]KAA2266469.1 type VII secretion protein EccCa [Solihabitans fulvus]
MTTASRSRDRRTPVPEHPTGEILLQAPPMLPKGSNQGAMQLMLFMPMMLGMGAMSFVYIGRGGGAMTYVFGALFVTSMAGMIIMSLARGGAAKKAQINDERRDYQRYLGGLRQQVHEVADLQRATLLAAQPDPADLWAFVDRGRLWERRRSDPDFGRVRIGAGPQRLATPLRAPQTVPLEDLDPVCSTSLRHFIRTYSTVSDLPVAVSLRSFAYIGVTGERAGMLGLARALLGQLAAFHAPSDLRIALCVAADRQADWDWAKWLPHAQCSGATDATGPTRLVADNLATLAALLGADLGDRPPFTRAGGMGFDYQHIVVVVDGGRTFDDVTLAPEGGRHGVTVLDVTSETPTRLPDQSTLCLHLGGDRMGMLVGEEGEQGIAFLGRPDQFDPASAEALARRLAPFDRGAPVVTETPMASNLGLPGLLGIGDPRDLDTDITWRPRSARERLRLPIGVDPDGRPVDLDLKESAEGGMGPHGLVIGATGSGKSELLRTLVTGLAVTHSSESLNLALIDFKGGATFAGMTELPHTCAVITNLSEDLALVDRMADAIKGELVRRQELLRAAGNHASVRDYEKARADGADLAPLPSLLVIIDEFSELLSSRPDFIDLFVMIGRLGRSLGIHLLLASQRLDEGRLRGLDSHLSYRVGLRTFSAAESRSVLGVPDAYQLPPVPGSAYLKVDTETLIRLKAAYVSGDLPPRGQVIAGPAQQRAVVPFTLAPLRLPPPREVAPARTAAVEQGGATETIMGAMVSRLTGRGPAAHQIWLPPLDEPPTLDQLLPPLGVDPERGLCPLGWGGNGRLVVPVAIVDKPFEQRRDLLWADLSGAAGHAIVVGAPQSGKSTLLRSLIGVLALTHTPAEAQFFVLDMGGGALGPIAGLPHVSGYANRRDAQRCRRVVAEVVTLLLEREQFFAANGIDSIATFRQRRAEFAESGADGREFGDVFLVVDDWTTLRQEYEALEEAITKLAARGLGFGIHVVVSASTWMAARAQLRDSIGTRFELRLGDPADSAIDRRAALNVPAGAPGRGLTGDKLHFLTALARVDGDQRGATAAAGATDLVARITKAWPGKPASQVRLLPREVSLTALPGVAEVPGRKIPLGLAEADLKPVYLDFGADPHFLAFGDVESGRTGLLRTIAAGIMARYTAKEAAIIVVDYRRGLLDAVTGDHLLGYAGAEPVLNGLVAEVARAMQTRLPGPDVTAEELRNRSWWSGPELFLLVDDYELVATTGRNPLSPLHEFLPQARDIGLHLVIVRGSGGASRALFEPVMQRVRELGSPGLVMSGAKEEGPLIGDVKPGPQPPGRGQLVRRRSGTALVQVAWTPPAS